MKDEIEVFREKILSEIEEYRIFVEEDKKLSYDEKIQKLGAILFIKQTVEFL